MTTDLTSARVRELLHYDPKTGDFTWTGLGTKSRKVSKGKKAGYKHHQGYISIKIDKKNYQAHQLVFLYMTGSRPSYPEYEIDHINRIKDDNRWDNLRICTHTQNMRNKAN